MKFQIQSIPQSDTELAAALLRFRGERPMFTSQSEKQPSDCKVKSNSAAFEITDKPSTADKSLKKESQDTATPLNVLINTKNKIDAAMTNMKSVNQPIRKHNFVAFETFHVTSPANVSLNESSPANVSSNDSLTDDNDSIRREKINAALQSMPQRGRKRDNLSEHERLELTRTRNREHAKSTRIRKKARYQELLDKEQMVEIYEAAALLNQKRRHRAVNFAHIRQSVLQTFLNKSGKLMEAGSPIQFQNDSDDFTFYSSPVNAMNDTSNDSGREAVRKFDEWLADQVLECCGRNEHHQVSYTVVSSNSVALTEDASAIMQTQLLLSSTKIAETNPVSLATMSFHLKFNPSSDKLQHVEICFTENSFEKQDTESLVSQTSHPSVVSLDPNQQNMFSDP